MGCFPSQKILTEASIPSHIAFCQCASKSSEPTFTLDTGAIRDILDAERPRAPSQVRLDPVAAAVVTQIFAWYTDQIFAWYTDVHAVWR